MPFGYHKYSNNRSKQALNDPHTPSSSSGAASPVPGSADEVRANATRSQVFYQQNPTQAQAQAQAQAQQPPPAPPQPVDAPSYAAFQTAATDSQPRSQSHQKSGDLPLPARSQSTRLHPSITPNPQASGSVENLLDARRLQQQHQERVLQPFQAPVETKKKSSIFERMRSSTSRTSEPKTPPQAQTAYNNTSGLARRLSKRHEIPSVLRTHPLENSQQGQQRSDWQSAQGSRSSILPSPQEGAEDDSGLDPYLITEPQQEPAHPPHTPITKEGPQYQTIRPVLDDTDALAYSTTDDQYSQFEAQQQHLREQLHHQHHRSESSSHTYYSPQDLAHPQHQGNFPGGALVAGDPYRQQNPETVSQLSYDSPVDQREEPQRPVSVQSNGQSPTGLGLQRTDFPNRTTSIPTGRPPSQLFPMAPTGSGQQRPRAEPKQNLQINQGPGAPDSRDPPPPNYSRGQFQGNPPQAGGVSPLPPGGTNNYRGGPPQRDQFGAAGVGEQGRSTPPPAPNDRDVNDAYKELLTKYKKVKGLYFDKTAQVESLQNTLANQRLSQSRTSLDDSEYMTRFQRLDGATTNLAFNIRKDWRQIPAWLSHYVNQDALKIGKQEMTAVGRACITKFLVDEVFNRTFHPGLESEFSMSLKSIEQNIRRFSPALNNQEESDALTAKVVQWRLATLEGLREVINSPESEEYKKQFTQMATTNLTASLINFLGEPIPPGIEDSAHMIVELAVSIAANLPLESRDISIIYPMPGDLLQTFIMKVESAIPALENPGADGSSDADAASTGSGEKDESSSKEGDKDGNKLRKDKTKSTGGMLQAMMGGGNSSSSTVGKKPVPGENINEPKKVNMEDGVQKVRFAGFVGVEVRGRQVLVKAPVWAVSG